MHWFFHRQMTTVYLFTYGEHAMLTSVCLLFVKWLSKMPYFGVWRSGGEAYDPKFELGWDFCTVQLAIKFQLATKFHYCITSRREWALLSFPDVPMFVCLSVMARPTAYHNWPITTKFGTQVHTCPRTHVSLFGSPVSHTLGSRWKNMENFAYFEL